MKNTKLLLLVFALLATFSLSFATPAGLPLPFDATGSWVGTAVLAIITSAALLAIIYMVGIGFEINDLKMLAN